MIKNRFTLEMKYWKGLPQGRQIIDKLTGQDGMSLEELCNTASMLYCHYEELKGILKVYKDCVNELEEKNKALEEQVGNDYNEANSLTVQIADLNDKLNTERNNTFKVINDYAKQFKRHTKEFSFMCDLAEDLGLDISKLEALDD